MRVGGTATGPVRTTIGTPTRRKLQELRHTFRLAVDDDREDPVYLLDDLDLDWLASLPATLPRGTLLNIVV